MSKMAFMQARKYLQLTTQNNFNYGALPDKAELLLDPVMDQELEKLIAQVSGLSVSSSGNTSGEVANVTSRPSSRISSPWRPLHHRKKIDTESEGSTEETDSSEN